jgi:hypothetical protein
MRVQAMVHGQLRGHHIADPVSAQLLNRFLTEPQHGADRTVVE